MKDIHPSDTWEYDPTHDIIHACGRGNVALCRIKKAYGISYYIGHVTCPRCLRWTKEMVETRLRRRKQSRRVGKE